MSLKDSLLNLIKSRGQLSYGEAVQIAMEDGQRPSTMERRMRELCKEENIEPIMARSKRGTEYISGWRVKQTGLTLQALDNIYSAVTSGQKPTHLMGNFGDGMVMIELPPAFEKKEQKETQDRLI